MTDVPGLEVHHVELIVAATVAGTGAEVATSANLPESVMRADSHSAQFESDHHGPSWRQDRLKSVAGGRDVATGNTMESPENAAGLFVAGAVGVSDSRKN